MEVEAQANSQLRMTLLLYNVIEYTFPLYTCRLCCKYFIINQLNVQLVELASVLIVHPKKFRLVSVMEDLPERSNP